MSTQKNLITLCFATVFTLGLAACGGGGGGDAPVADMMDNGDPDDTMTSSLVGKVFPDGTMFMLPAGLVDDITVSVEEGASVPVPGVGIFECVTGPCTVDVTSDVVTTTGLIEVVSLAEGLPAEVLTVLASNTEDAPAGPTPATPEQMTAAAATKVTAIDKEAAQTTEAGLGGSSPTGVDVDSTYSMTIERDRDGTTVEIKDSANAGDDDPKFIKQDVDLGEGRTMHVRTMAENDDGEVVEEVVIVKTDIKAPKATAFAKVADESGTLTQVLAVNTNLLNDDPAVTFEALAVNQADPDVLKLVKSADFVPGAGTTTELTFARAQADGDDTTDGAQAVVAFETEGTYNGAMGMYKCNAADGGGDDCAVSLDAKGAITAMSVGWIFTPATGAKSYVADANYLEYGFWLMRTTKDGATTYNEVETFAEAQGFDVTDATELEGVTGSAVYEGGSVGVYVKNVLDDQANIVSATSGHFSADVELTANFGGGGVPANDQFTIGGKITGFVLQHGEANDWEVGLGLADFGNRVDGNEPGKSRSRQRPHDSVQRCGYR